MSSGLPRQRHRRAVHTHGHACAAAADGPGAVAGRPVLAAAMWRWPTSCIVRPRSPRAALRRGCAQKRRSRRSARGTGACRARTREERPRAVRMETGLSLCSRWSRLRTAVPEATRSAASRTAGTRLGSETGRGRHGVEMSRGSTRTEASAPCPPPCGPETRVAKPAVWQARLSDTLLRPSHKPATGPRGSPNSVSGKPQPRTASSVAEGKSPVCPQLHAGLCRREGFP